MGREDVHDRVRALAKVQQLSKRLLAAAAAAECPDALLQLVTGRLVGPAGFTRATVGAKMPTDRASS